jgi:hypothetical protein
MIFKWACGWTECKHPQKGEADKYGATLLTCEKCRKESRALIAIRQRDNSSIAIDVVPIVRET